MKILKNVFELNKAINNYKNVGFVPTMGGIHKGHESLIKISQKNKKATIVIISHKTTEKNIRNCLSIFKKNRNILKFPTLIRLYN